MPARSGQLGGPRLAVAARSAMLGAAFLVSSAAEAVPRDAATFDAVVSQGLLNTTSNEVHVIDVAGAYIATRLNVSGTLAEVALSTWASDARILATSPLDVQTTIQPFVTQSFDGTIDVEVPHVDLALPLGLATGQWRRPNRRKEAAALSESADESSGRKRTCSYWKSAMLQTSRLRPKD